MFECQSQEESGEPQVTNWEPMQLPQSLNRTPPEMFEGLVKVKKESTGEAFYEHQIFRMDNGILNLYKDQVGDVQDPGAVKLSLAETEVQCHSVKHRISLVVGGSTYILKTGGENGYRQWVRALQQHVGYARSKRSEEDQGTKWIQRLGGHFRTQHTLPHLNIYEQVLVAEQMKMEETIELAANAFKLTAEAINQLFGALRTSAAPRFLPLSDSSARSPITPTEQRSCEMMPNNKFEWRRSLPAARPVKESVPLSFFRDQLTSAGVVRVPMRGALSITIYMPISFVQLTCKSLGNSFLLDRAADENEPVQRMCWVVAFAHAHFWTHYNVWKPFESYLGETYEMDRWNDLGWRHHSEKVTVDPPVNASYTKGHGWSLTQNLSYTFSCEMEKDRLVSNENYTTELHLGHRGERYKWNGVGTDVQNFSREDVYISHRGTINVECSSGARGELNIQPCTGPNEPCRANGFASSNERRVQLVGECSMAGQRLCQVDDDGQLKILSMSPDMRPYHTLYYGLTEFEIGLNQMYDGVPSTDTRNRRDMRLLEEGKWQDAFNANNIDDANEHKRIKSIKQGDKLYTPSFFKPGKDWTGKFMWKSNHCYWKIKSERLAKKY